MTVLYTKMELTKNLKNVYKQNQYIQYLIFTVHIEFVEFILVKTTCVPVLRTG